MATALQIFSLVHHSHAATTELLHDAVAVQGLSDNDSSRHGGRW